MNFSALCKEREWNDLAAVIEAKSADDVRRALRCKTRRSLDDFAALVSPAAAPFLEEMAQESAKITTARFGKTIQLYIPIYLSNLCHNICSYCGYRQDNAIERKVLDQDEMAAEFEAVRKMGFAHVLLVTGEAGKIVGVDYLAEAVELAGKYFSHVSLEVQPLGIDDYRRLRQLGLLGVYVYQETYRRERYGAYHLKGRKRNFAWRLDTPDRLGAAGIHEIGLGFLLGLEDWRREAVMLARHLRHLERRYWRTRFSISFPRLRAALGAFQAGHLVGDRDFVQAITAFRLFDENVGLSLSTRESAAFRDRVLPLGITQVSAGSRTEPGAYSVAEPALPQFSIHDLRDPQEVAAAISRLGFDPVWRNWQPALADRPASAPPPRQRARPVL